MMAAMMQINSLIDRVGFKIIRIDPWHHLLHFI
jgi:hypothetical protein